MSAGRTSTYNKTDWNTPPEMVKLIENFYGGVIDLDPCYNEHSFTNPTKCYTEKDDGLKHNWTENNIFVNPPYGRSVNSYTGVKTTIKDWISKCYEAYMGGSNVLALIPVAPNTSHWKDYIFQSASCVCFIAEPRYKFYSQGDILKKGAPMAVCLVYWGSDIEKFSETFDSEGNILYSKL